MNDSAEKVSLDERQFQAAVRCRSVKKYYGAVKAVDEVDLEVRKGECFGLLGPNGAGKTTLVEILEGLTRPDRGLVEVLGYQWGMGDDRSFRERISVQLQETQLADKLTVAETIRIFRSFYRQGRSVEEVIRKAGLEEKQGERVMKLSGGTKQKLALACALVSEPELLFLDEPTTGLDPQARYQVWEIVEEFKSRRGTVLLTTHYMEEAARLCDRVAIMDHGKILAMDRPELLVESLVGRGIIEFRAGEDFDETLLAQLPSVKAMERKNSGFVLKVLELNQTLPALLAEVEKRNLKLAGLVSRPATLEDVFIALTGGKLKDE